MLIEQCMSSLEIVRDRIEGGFACQIIGNRIGLQRND
jgi:hypothetical protein